MIMCQKVVWDAKKYLRCQNGGVEPHSRHTLGKKKNNEFSSGKCWHITTKAGKSHCGGKKSLLIRRDSPRERGKEGEGETGESSSQKETLRRNHAVSDIRAVERFLLRGNTPASSNAFQVLKVWICRIGIPPMRRIFITFVKVSWFGWDQRLSVNETLIWKTMQTFLFEEKRDLTVLPLMSTNLSKPIAYATN